MLIDSHCHVDLLNLERHQGSLDSVVASAKAEGVETILCVGINPKDFDHMLGCIQPYNNIYASVGLHPNEPELSESLTTVLTQYASNPKVIAIGETGLDYYRSEGDLNWQKKRFIEHIEVAKAFKKPLIIHTRQAGLDTLEILSSEGRGEVEGVIHCFTESLEFAKKALELNFYISISGIVTYKNAEELRSIVKTLPLDRILIETDAPFLAPVPFRGTPNEPAYVKFVAEKLAEVLKLPFDVIAEKTTENFRRLFNV